MSFFDKNTFNEEFSSWLMRKSWKKFLCSNCNTTYFAREESCPFCDSKKIYTKKKITIDAFVEKCKLFFENRLEGKEIKINSVNSLTGKNVFIVNCLELLSADESSFKYGIIPCIRMNSEHEYCSVQGHSTSCGQLFLMKYNADEALFFSTIEYFIDLISRFGVHISRIGISWGESFDNGYEGYKINFSINGKIIGNGNIYSKTPFDQGKVVINFWFGVERAIWALCGGDYYDLIHSRTGFENFLGEKNVLEDRLRTLTLFYMSGLRVSNKDGGYHVKKFIKFLNNMIQDFNIAFYVKYYYEQWKSIVDCSCSWLNIVDVFLYDYQYIKAVEYCQKNNRLDFIPKLKNLDVDPYEYAKQSIGEK